MPDSTFPQAFLYFPVMFDNFYQFLHTEILASCTPFLYIGTENIQYNLYVQSNIELM